jgi:uncharacterized protein (DUF58 family)
MNSTKLVPGFRLLLLVGAVIMPAALLAAVPGWQFLSYALIAAAVLTAIVDAILSPRRLSHITVRSDAIVRMWKDRETSIDLIIRNESQTKTVLRIGLLFPVEITAPQDDRRIVLPEGAEFSRTQWECTPRKRGQYFITQCAIERPSALGLWAVRKTLPLQVETRVYPNLAGERKKSPAFFKRGRLGMHMQRQLGKGREFEKLREYASGDSFEDVDWKATARRGHPITRVFQVERTQEIYIILDASRLTARPVPSDPAAPLANAPGPEPRLPSRDRKGAVVANDEINPTILERNVTASLLLALAAEKQGDLFGLITFSDRVHKFVRARNGKAHYSACRDALYTLHARPVTPDFEELFSLLRLRLRRRALLIFLTELDDPIVAETFVRNLKLLRHHLVLVGMARPAGAQPLFEDPQVNDVDDVYQKLAGHISWSKLRELGRVLASQGVRFSLLDADTLGPELAAIYLDLKQRQLL